MDAPICGGCAEVGNPERREGSRSLQLQLATSTRSLACCAGVVDQERTNAGRLRPWERVAYGAGELGPAMAGSTMIFFQFVFLTNVAGLAAGLAGSVLLIGKVWDAVNDPLIGWLSDHTRSRWGRRLPWMVGAVVPFAVLFMLMWYVPGFAEGKNQWGLFAYYAVVAVLYNTCYTALALPHSSLTAELSSDYDERSRITGFRMGFSLAGSVGGLLVGFVIFEFGKGLAPTVQYLIFAGVVALMTVVAVGICVAGIWRLVVARDQERVTREARDERGRESGLAGRVHLSWRDQARIILGNRPYLLVCGIYLASWLAMQFTASMLPLYVKSVMGLPVPMFYLLALTVQVTALGLIPFWGWLSIRIGKKPVYFYGMACWLVAQAGLLFLEPGQVVVMFGVAFLAGFGISVCYLIPNAMLPDTLEYDELQTGQRREGLFYGFFVFLQKMALALGTFIVGLALEAAGYLSTGPGEAAVEQPASALTAIRLAIGPLPAAALVLGMVLTWLYPITKARHAEILARLAERRAARA